MFCKKKIFITATTPLSFLQEFSPKVINYKREVNPNVNIKCINLSKDTKSSFNQTQAKNLYKLAARNIVSSLNPNERKLHCIFLNDKKEHFKLKEYAIKQGFDIEVIHSDPEIKQNSEAYKALTTNKPIKLDKKAKILVFTSLAYDSVGICNAENEIGKIFILGEKFTENVIQIIGRPENAKSLEVFYFLAENNKKHDFKDCYGNHRAKYFIDYQKQINQLKKYITSKDEKYKFINHDINLVLPNGSFDQLKCVQEYEKNKALYQANQQKFDILNRLFNIEIEKIDVKNISTLLKSDNNKAKENEFQLLLDIEEEKNKKEVDLEKAKNLLLHNLHFCLLYLISKRIDQRVKKSIKDFLYENNYPKNFMDKNFINWKESTYIDDDIIKLLASYSNKILQLSKYFNIDENLINICFDGKYKTIIGSLGIIEILDGMNKSKQGIINKVLYDDIINAIIPGAYTKIELLDNEGINSAFSKWKHKVFSERQKLTIIHQLFGTNSKVIKIEGKSTRITEIENRVTIDSIAESYTLTVQKSMPSIYIECNQVL